MVRPRIFLPHQKGHRVLNFCHHKLSLSQPRSTSASEVQTSTVRDCNLRPSKVCKSTKTSFRYFSILPCLKPNHFICVNFAHFLFSIHHLNMFAEMPVRTGFRIVLSFCENTYNFAYFLFFFFLYYFWFFAHLD
jgi:hypothetical protein